MGEFPVPRATSTTTDQRLDSWKEIATYLKRDVTTVQRWEKREGMPVHRHVHDKLGSVYAFRSELDVWSSSRNPGLSQDRVPLVTDQPGEAVRAVSAATRGRDRLGFLLLAAGVLLVAAVVTWWWRLEQRDEFWQNPFASARFETLTDFGGAEQAAAISRDGRFVAFLSNRSGQMDVWVTQVGTGQFYNLTKGRAPELVNPSIRSLGFSPDASLVTFWTRRADNAGDIGVWAIPTLGGAPRPYLQGAAEFDWSQDGSRLVYHTPAAGDPMFVRGPGPERQDRRIFAATAGLHAHFPLWSPDGGYVYFVQGTLPDAMDVWRIGANGGAAERITRHNSRVTNPVLLDAHTLVYLATDADGSGPWLYGMDIRHGVPHRLDMGLDRFTSLSASADGMRLVATRAGRNGSLWRLDVGAAPASTSVATSIALTTAPGFSPRIGPDYLLYVSSEGTTDAIWKLTRSGAAEMWSAAGARVVGGPEIAPDGRRVAFCVAQGGRTQLYVVNDDGTNTRVVSGALDVRGSPAWAPDGQSIAAAAQVDGAPRVFRIGLAGTVTPLVQDYSTDPVWAPGGDLLLYSGADVGTAFAVKAVDATGRPRAIPGLSLTRGGRRIRFVHGRHEVVIMRGEIQHKDLWLVDLDTGAQRRLTTLPQDFDVRDFDVSPDGSEIVLERVQEQSDIVLIDRRTRR